MFEIDRVPAQDRAIEARAALGTSAANRHLSQYPEAMALVEPPVGEAGRFEIGGLLIAIADGQRVPHQLRSIPPSMKGRVNADQGNVPVGFMGMKTRHLFEQEQHFAKLPPGHSPLKQRGDRPVVWLNTRRQPLRDPDKVTDNIGGAMVEGLSMCPVGEQYAAGISRPGPSGDEARTRHVASSRSWPINNPSPAVPANEKNTSSPIS
jgi:hypothetical protein